MFLTMRARKHLLLSWMMLAAACTSRAPEPKRQGNSATKPAKISSGKKVHAQIGEAPGVTAEQAAELAQRGRAALRTDNFRDGAMYLEQACNGGDLGACGLFADLLDRGRGVPEDAARARELFEQACAGGLQSACDRLGH
jgi:TPR repeat protein